MKLLLLNNFIFLLFFYTSNVKAQPILISEDPLNYTDAKCEDNPFLFLLPDQMRHTIAITLSKTPGNRNLNYCQNKNITKTCCTSFTYSNIKTYLTDHLYTPKQNIYETNLYYYKNVIDEHRRNIVKGFKIKKEVFNDLFRDYHKKVKEIIKLSEEIVTESVKYNWNAFCNYICNFPASLSNCEIKALTYNVNSKYFFDFKYECKGEKDFIDKFVEKLKEFEKMKRDLNTTIETFYAEIRQQSSSKVQNLLDSSKFALYSKSLDDGEYVSKNLNQPVLWEKNKTTTYQNQRLNKTVVTIYTNNTSIYSQPCGLYNCLDDFFMQFYDVHENNNSHIIRQFNYSKTIITPTNSTDSSFIYYHFDDDIEDLTDGKIKFDSAKYFSNINVFILFTIIIYFFL